MSGITTNAQALARRIEAKLRALDKAIVRGVSKAANKVEREQIKRLIGSNAAAPGAYPVPARTGGAGLLGNVDSGGKVFSESNERYALVMNRATYALTVHEGLGSSRKFGRRPFLEDALLATDSGEIMAAEVRKALEAV